MHLILFFPFHRIGSSMEWGKIGANLPAPDLHFVRCFYFFALFLGVGSVGSVGIFP